jgi:apolipoprotein N-acyltransferase
MATKTRIFSWYWLPILSGILVGTSYIPFPAWAMAFALVPLWLWWSEQNSPWRIWWGGWITQFTLNMIGFNWVAHTVHEFGHLPWPIAIAALVLFSSVSSLHFPLSGPLWWGISRKLKLNKATAGPLLAATFIVCENIYPMIFDWHLGYSLMVNPFPHIQLAEWIGFRGLSSLLVVLNLGFFLIWQARNQVGRRRRLALGLVAGLFIANLIGWMLVRNVPSPDRTVRALIVQANIGNLEKQEAERGDFYREHILDRYIALTTQGLVSGPVDFAVWPETAFPHLLNEPYLHTQPYAGRLREFLQASNLTLVTGGYGLDPLTSNPLNSTYIISPAGQLLDTPYTKTRLLAFGEYLPGGEMFPILKKWLPDVGNFGRGAGPEVKSMGSLKLGPLICYEGLFDDLARTLANNGAQIFVAHTNDSWYGIWQQPFQHLWMTAARAIEFRRPLIRATNTGISTVTLADGSSLLQSPLRQEWFHTYEIPIATTPKKTLFMGWGFYFPWSLVALLALMVWRKKNK